jgi:hypothetical protein
VEVFSVLCISQGVSFVPVGLTCLRKQDEWRCVSRLQAEREVEENEWIDVERHDAKSIYQNPDGDHDRLADEEHRRPKETRECLGFERKPVCTENWRKVGVGTVESERMMIRFFPPMVACVLW